MSIMLKNHWMPVFAWLWLCVFCATVPATGGAVDLSGSPYIVDSWNNEDGLPDGEVISVIQARDGYFWLGTLHGLVRFDGSHFAIFDENNLPGLGSDRIVRLFEDSHTNLWIGTDTAGVVRLHDGQVKNFNIGGGGHEGRLTSVGEDASGGVWLYTADARLGRYQNGKMEVLDFHIATPAIARMIAAEKSARSGLMNMKRVAPAGCFRFEQKTFIRRRWWWIRASRRKDLTLSWPA